MDAVKSCFTQYVGFKGRARRSEYWYFVLFELLVGVILSVLASVTGATIFTGISGIFSLACLLPGLGVSVRRMHDIGKTGWVILLGLIPLVGSIILIIWACKDSDPGENQYGPNPKGV